MALGEAGTNIGMPTMSQPTHIIRFIAREDNKIYLGQPCDISRDVGLDCFEGKETKAYLINGTVFDGQVSETVCTVKQLLSPISAEDCNYIRCLGLNYQDHAKEAGLDVPEAPTFFTKPRAALADPYPGLIMIPKFVQDESSDYEAELCVIIGKTGRDIPEDRALDYVLGYTCSNDVSARLTQLLTSQWCFSKGLDGSCPLGPVLVTKDAIADPQTLAIKTIYNSLLVQDGNTRDMIFDIKKQISYLSQGTTLEAGTILLTGTPAGIGFRREPRIALKDQDVVQVWIEGIGTLANEVQYEQQDLDQILVF